MIQSSVLMASEINMEWYRFTLRQGFESFKVLICLTVLMWLMQVLWKRRKLYIYAWNIPGPSSFPVIGSLYKFMGSTQDILRVFIELQSEYPGMSKIWLGPKLIITVTQPEYIEKVLNSPLCLDKDDHAYGFIRKCVGYGLLTAPVERWRPHRRIISPSFNIRILESFVKIFARQSEVLSRKLEEHVGQNDVDLFNLLSLYTMDTVCETAMGVKLNVQQGDCKITVNLDKMMELLFLRMLRVWYRLDLLWKLLPISKEYDRAISVCGRFTTKVIRTKIEAHQKKIADRKSGLIVNTEESNRIKASLDLMLENSGFTEKELREEVEILIMAATDTSAAALTFSFICLGMYPDIQERVYKEVMNVIGDDREISPSDLPRLTYLDMVIKETLRIFPVAPIFVRQLTGDVDIGDAILPEGASVSVSLLNTHRDPRYWPEPLKFDPERFLPENVAKRHPFAYLPFSGGPRNCIGNRYAMMNMKTSIATILRKFKVFSDYKSLEDIKLKIHLVLRLVGRPKVRFELRH